MKKIISGAVFIGLVMVFISMNFIRGFAQSTDNQEFSSLRNLDVGVVLRESEATAFSQEELKMIQDGASLINFDSAGILSVAANEGDFTFNGGSKSFLGINLEWITFTQRSVGDNVEVWVANNLNYGYDRSADVVTQAQVDRLRDEFDNNIYPTDTGFFGTEDTHDGTQSLLEAYGYVPEGYYSYGNKNIILVENIKDDSYYANTGYYVAGFYWGTIEQYVDRNIVTIDSNAWFALMPNDDPRYVDYQYNMFGTLAHEYQHLIHDDNDPAETTWINEGMSDFAQFLCGYGHPWDHVEYFMNYPENSMLVWDDYNSIEVLADYGEAYLLQLYLYDHYGQEFIRELAVSPLQGIDSVNAMLKSYHTKINFDTLYQRFLIAAMIDDPTIDCGLYSFSSIDININVESAMANDKFGLASYGGQYSEIDLNHAMNFMSVESAYWQIVNYNSDNVIWSYMGNGLDQSIVVKADLRKLHTATLEFDHRYNIEEGWDYAFVQVSTNNGATWASLSNENTRSDFADNPSFTQIAAQQVGFTGSNGEFTHEVFDLSSFAGHKVLIAFRYMTDEFSNGNSSDDILPGWYLDNISISQVHFLNNGNTFKGLTVNEEINLTFIFITELELCTGQIVYSIQSLSQFDPTTENILSIFNPFRHGTTYMIAYNTNPYGNVVPFEYSIR